MLSDVIFWWYEWPAFNILIRSSSRSYIRAWDGRGDEFLSSDAISVSWSEVVFGHEIDRQEISCVYRRFVVSLRMLDLIWTVLSEIPSHRTNLTCKQSVRYWFPRSPLHS